MTRASPPLILKMTCDPAPLIAAIDELVALTVNAPNGFVEALSRVADSFVDLVCLEQDLPATPVTNEVAVVLKSSELMNRILATARAGDFDLAAFDARHDFSSVGCLEPTNQDQASAESQGSAGVCASNSQERT